MVARTLLTIWIAIFLTTKKAKVRDSGGVDEIPQIAEYHSCTADVARFKLFHRLNHRQWHLIVICMLKTQCIDRKEPRSHTTRVVFEHRLNRTVHKRKNTKNAIVRNSITLSSGMIHSNTNIATPSYFSFFSYSALSNLFGF